ncbi:class I SAM-dependent methyltransferase [Salsipaludibacter albus]|uniref:class I SAM-dependent methyltransferase n=1 Tax=Salsipaludibacter albus TaxID=2849650 RepID=UPI001EE469BF|nr:class I SAM-dependent methyltransferase [Salsipaludibacter albus]MBY5163740.1 methyltransferase domain-containing protein [Salsipaludibacter albus]
MTDVLTPTSTSDHVAERVLASALGAIDTLSIALGDRLGWYDALAERGACTPSELAGATGTSVRYAREWLEQQATTGLLEVEEGDPRRFRMSPAVAEVMTDRTSLAHVAPLARMLAAAGARFHDLVDAYRADTGVSWEDFGVDMRESQSDMNRPWFEHELAGALAGTPIAPLLARPDASIADVGCGGGWSSIALAVAHPDATVVGYDVDAPSIELARRNAADAGVADRVRFEVADVGREHLPGGHDVVFAFECVHDMPRPVEVLAAMRRMTAPDGAVVVMDEAVADELQAPGDEVERLMYGFSLLVCLPDGKSGEDSAATGTVIRRSILREYARAAGFDDLQELATGEFGFFRFYHLA